MALEQSLKEICSGLTSIRVNERKKSAEALKDMLSRSAMPSLLTENTYKKSGYTWNQVFNDINEYILKETEKYETNKNFDNVVGSSTSLLNLCISGSNKGGAHMKCDIIIEASLNIFNDNRLRKAIGDAYYSVLYKHVLNNDYYIGFITPSMWENLLEACVNLCLCNSSHMDILTKIKLLWMVIKNASNSVQFVVCVRDSLENINKCLKKVMDDKKTQEFVMKIFILLVEMLSTESRLLICEFTECNLPTIFKFYDHSMDVKKKSLLFKALSVAVIIHHPCGRLKHEEGSLAHDWNVWNKLLHSVLEIVCLEISYTQKHVKQNIACENFSFLAAITYYQIFNESQDSNDGVESVAKRPKMNLNKNKCFNDIIKELQQSGPPWVDIIHFYVQQFKHSLNADDYISLIKTSEILIQNVGRADFDNLSEICCSAIEYFVGNPENITYYINVFYDMLNACIRKATTPAAEKFVHLVIYSILRLDVLKYSHVQPLLVLYFDKGIPLTNRSLKTLAFVYSKFYSNCSYMKQRMKCVEWLKQMSIIDVDVKYLGDLLLRLISDENMVLNEVIQSKTPKIHDVIFDSLDTNILFANFEYDIKDNDIKSKEEDVVAVEFNQEMCSLVLDYINSKLNGLAAKPDCADILMDRVKFVHLTLNLYESLQKYKIISKEFIISTELYVIVVHTLKQLFVQLARSLRSDELVGKKIKLLKSLQELLRDDYGSFLNGVARSCIDENCFHAVNEVLKTEVQLDEDDDDIETGPLGLRYQCVYFLAAYCYQSHTYTDELVKCILDEDLYKLDVQGDINCALKCIEMVKDHDKEDKYLDSVFGLMKNLCKVLFRNSKASYGLLQILLQLLDRIWIRNDSVMIKNCIIMVKGYYDRCNKLYYTPRLAAIIYECAARVIKLNRKHGFQLEFDMTLTDLIKGNVHNLRIYSCYLLKYCYDNLDVDDVKQISCSLMGIFVITVPNENELVLKDETINRTLTVFHCFRALSKIRHWLLHNIVFQIIHIQKLKSLNKSLTRKALNLIVKDITQRNFADYVHKNILDILYSWFIEGEKFESLPLNILGFKLDTFLEQHLKWLVASDVLWGCKGYIEKSDTVKLVAAKSKKTVEDVVETCFCTIITLCLPYIVIEKYKMEIEKQADFKMYFESSNRMFHSTRLILDNEKWSNLFVEHLGQLILLAATRVCDPRSAREDFQLQEIRMTNRFMCSKAVFKGVLQYFGELIDGDVMEYLSENQPLVVLNILFKLWGNFVHENVSQFKILQLHTYMSFIENIKLGFASDAVLFSFILNGLANAINTSEGDGLRATIGVFKTILERLRLANKLVELRGNVSAKVVAILSAKEPSLEFNGLDGVDSVVYESSVGQYKCTSKAEFENMLQMYTKSLIYPSNKILCNLRDFLRTNSDSVSDICKELNMKGFSEDCSDSLVHCLINALSDILKTNEDKVVIEACNCLAEMATYDIKTLVTSPPGNTVKLGTFSAKEYFTYKALKALSSELFDIDPMVNSEVAVVINRILKYRDGKIALDIEGINKEILQPLAPSNSDVYSEYQIDEKKIESVTTELWIPRAGEYHLNWVVRIAKSLLSLIAPGNNCAGALSAVCAVKPSLSAKIMPSICGLLFDSDSRAKSEKLIKIQGEQLNEFFVYIWKLSFDDKLESSEDGTSTVSSRLDHNHKMIIQYTLELIDFVRLQAKNYRIKKALPLNYLKLDYKKVAWASALADLNLVAIYYGELWAAAQNGGVPPSSPDATSNLDGGSHLQRIFRGCFVSIGELDAVEGCGTAHLTSEDEKRKHLINTGQFTDSLLLHDIALSTGSLDQSLQCGAVASLHKAGMYHLALQYIKSCPESEPLDDIKYDCLSLLGDWSDFVDTRELEMKSKLTFNTNTITKKFRYACLKQCLNIQPIEDCFTKLEQPLNAAKLAISRLSRRLNMENSQCVYKVMACLHLFRDVESYFAVRCGSSLNVLLDRWRIDKLPPYKDFKYLESLLSQRSVILQHAAENYGLYLEKINSLQLQYAELGLSNQRVQMAQRIVAMVKRFQPSKEVTLLESKVSWEKGHKDIALSLLHDNIIDETENAKLTAMSLRQYGLWMAECKRENARDIINQYLEKSLEVLKACDDLDTRNKVYYDIAQFADAEYKLVVSYMSSSTFENKVKCMESMKGTAASLRSSQQTLTRDEKKALIANNAFRQMDEAEIANTRAEKETFLNLAMRYYLLSLKQSEDNNLSIFRVISLWFENHTINLSDLAEALRAVPSWKFITVLPQIAPRLSSEDTTFVQLKEIIMRCAKDHPHHTLPILFNLKNSDKDKNYGKNQSQLFRSPPEPRVIAAGELISELVRDNPKMAILIGQMDKLYDAIISFAYFTSPALKDIGKPLPVPKDEAIYRLRNLDSIPVPTDTIAIQRNCDYSNLSSFSGFDNSFEMVGGINYPKKVNCRSSDGSKRILLIKGEDDMRQDAVMQQVFTIVNTLLKKNPVTYHNKLLIRTYKVVALSRRSGVLEWCAGTIPLGTYLTNAHVRHRPQDISPNIARGKMKESQEKKLSNKQKLAVFNEILRVFKPVFHYFFTEHYLDPVTWYERRLAYTRSVATSSMVGYILGLGDRHVQNILIDKTTAEVIHIDFGIAFDQGKTLLTPETVPFRLTQDIVAGFGCSGVEGIFRRCCEKTLQLLRDNQETLLTILEVLLCDPLYLWIVPTTKTPNESRVETGSGGLAERALLAVRSKLNGAESGAGGVSVRGQVAALLHRATDRANLCRLFHGWQPYL